MELSGCWQCETLTRLRAMTRAAVFIFQPRSLSRPLLNLYLPSPHIFNMTSKGFSQNAFLAHRPKDKEESEDELAEGGTQSGRRASVYDAVAGT